MRCKTTLTFCAKPLIIGAVAAPEYIMRLLSTDRTICVMKLYHNISPSWLKNYLCVVFFRKFNYSKFKKKKTSIDPVSHIVDSPRLYFIVLKYVQLLLFYAHFKAAFDVTELIYFSVHSGQSKISLNHTKVLHSFVF